jgi:hypothetical protein
MSIFIQIFGYRGCAVYVSRDRTGGVRTYIDMTCEGDKEEGKQIRWQPVQLLQTVTGDFKILEWLVRILVALKVILIKSSSFRYVSTTNNEVFLYFPWFQKQFIEDDFV